MKATRSAANTAEEIIACSKSNKRRSLQELRKLFAVQAVSLVVPAPLITIIKREEHETTRLQTRLPDS